MRKSSLPLIVILLFLCSGCSKDFLRRYDQRILGEWRITDVDRIGLGESANTLTFRNGVLDFKEDGKLVYTSDANVKYNGTWDIQKRTIDDETVQRLQISVVDFSTQEILSEFYDDINFTGKNRFNAQIVRTYATYITRFRR